MDGIETAITALNAIKKERSKEIAGKPCSII